MYNISSGNIQAGVLYLVYGAQSVTYNNITYITGQSFRGIAAISAFTFSGTGTQLVYALLEASGAGVMYQENVLDSPIFPDTTKLSGFAIEYLQNAEDILFNDITTLNGFAIELLD